MKKKILYSSSIVLVFTLIYAISTGIYYSCMYRALNYYNNVDNIFGGFFYLLNIIGILAVSYFMKGHYTKKRMIISYSFSLFSCIFAALIIFLPLSKMAFTIFLVLIFILIGLSQGSYVFLLTLFFPKSNRCMGLGIAASLSVLINSAFSLIDEGTFVQSIYAVIIYLVIAVAACGILIFTFKHLYNPEGTVLDTSAEDNEHTPIWNSKGFIYTCFFIGLSWAIQSLGFFFPFNDSLVLGINSESLRLTNVLGLLLGGYLVSRDKRAGAISCLILLATPMLYIMLQAQAGISLIIYFLSYFFTGVLSIYRISITADLSDSFDTNDNQMTFYCAFGLIFGRLGEGLGGLLGIKLTNDTMMLLTATSFILVTAVAFFVFHYLEIFTPIPSVVQNHNDKMTAFKVKYSLSSREMDVLSLLLDDDSNSEIAEKLFVSENTIRFHVSNILKKTGCKRRNDIIALFYETSL